MRRGSAACSCEAIWPWIESKPQNGANQRVGKAESYIACVSKAWSSAHWSKEDCNTNLQDYFLPASGGAGFDTTTEAPPSESLESTGSGLLSLYPRFLHSTRSMRPLKRSCLVSSQLSPGTMYTHRAILHSKYCLLSSRQLTLSWPAVFRQLKYDFMKSRHSPRFNTI